MHDHYWLYNVPQCPNAIAWSADNHLAVAAGHTVTILSPGHLDGARAFAETEERVQVGMGARVSHCTHACCRTKPRRHHIRPPHGPNHGAHTIHAHQACLPWPAHMQTRAPVSHPPCIPSPHPLRHQVQPLLVDAAPVNPQLSAQLSWSVLAEVRSTEQLTAATKATVRSLGWSPAGVTAQGGCLLAVVNTDHMVGPVRLAPCTWYTLRGCGVGAAMHAGSRVCVCGRMGACPHRQCSEGCGPCKVHRSACPCCSCCADTPGAQFVCMCCPVRPACARHVRASHRVWFMCARVIYGCACGSCVRMCAICVCVQVSLYAAPSSSTTSQWEQVADVTDMTRTAFRASNWEVGTCVRASRATRRHAHAGVHTYFLYAPYHLT